MGHAAVGQKRVDVTRLDVLSQRAVVYWNDDMMFGAVLYTTSISDSPGALGWLRMRFEEETRSCVTVAT